MAHNVLITGGSGFLGRAILKYWPPGSRFTIYSRDEMKQWEMRQRYPEARYILGDVGDYEHLKTAMYGHDIVIHAAAVKFIPEAEQNVAKTIAVNIEGSVNVARAAVAASVATVVGVSTDKACAPTTTYGTTKLVMERLFAEADKWNPATRFVLVRYGNVVGSTGSVIPIFFRQLGETGRLKLTDPDMTRFWLSPEQAVHVIRWALANIDMWPGHTFIPACPAMSLLDLAGTVYRLWCYEQGPWKDWPASAPVDYIGRRPAEKLHEVLLDDSEAPRSIATPLDEVLGGYVLPSPLSKNLLGGDAGYSSDLPERWVQSDQMAAWIHEAQEL